jgi:hypothetical protein
MDSGPDAGLTALRDIAKRLRHRSRADNSHAADSTTWNNWSRLCLRYDFPLWVYPCTVGSPQWYDQSEQLECFVSCLFRTHKIAASSIASYMSNLGAIHLSKFNRNTLKDYHAYNADIKGIRRIQSEQGRKKNTKDPFTMKMYKQARRHIRFRSPYEVTLATAILMGITFLLRISELLPCKRSRHHLRWGNVSINRDAAGNPISVTITIPHSKMDFADVTRTMPLSSDQDICVVRAVDRYRQSFGASPPKDDDPFLQTPSGTPNLSRTTISKFIARLATSLGLKANIGSHSLRKGGATSLCSGGKIAGYLVQLHGRWSSDTWKKIYQTITSESSIEISHQFSLAADTTIGH